MSTFDIFTVSYFVSLNLCPQYNNKFIFLFQYCGASEKLPFILLPQRGTIVSCKDDLKCHIFLTAVWNQHFLVPCTTCVRKHVSLLIKSLLIIHVFKISLEKWKNNLRSHWSKERKVQRNHYVELWDGEIYTNL